MNYPSDKRKKSISFHADTYEKIKRRKNLSGFINDLIRKHFDKENKAYEEKNTSSVDECFLQELQQKNLKQEEIIQASLSCMNPEQNFFNFKKGLTIAKKVKADRE